MIANLIKQELMKKTIDVTSDVMKIALLDNTFTFDPDTHTTWGAVSAKELTTANGYATGTLTYDSIAVDNTLDLATATFDDFTWTASGGDIGPANGAIIYDDTHAQKVVVGYADFGTAQTATDGGTFKIANIKIRVK